MTASPTDRRSVLRGLASLPLVSGGLASCAPGPVFAAPIGADHPDAALIAQAVKVEALAARERAALNRWCVVHGAAEDAYPKRPRAPSLEDYASPVTVEETIDGGRIMRIPPSTAYPGYDAARAEHAAAVEAHEAECAAIDQRFGAPAADRLHQRIDRRLSETGIALAALTPTTPAGVTAKARGCLAALGCYDGSVPPDWLDDLMRSVLVAVVAIGGAS